MIDALTKVLARTGPVVVLLTAVATTAAAQPATAPPPTSTEKWEILIAPYGILGGLSGTVGIKGIDTPVEMSASELFSHLKGGFMGYVGAKKNGWGFGLDTIYMSLGTEVTQGIVSVEPDVKQGMYTFLATRQLSPAAELVFGARVNDINTTLAFTAPIHISPSQGKTWVDPVVGVNFVAPVGGKSKVTLLADVGGFGVGSTIAVDLFPTYQLRIAKHAWLALGYRYIYTDYSDDEGFLYKTSVHGPAFGLLFPF